LRLPFQYGFPEQNISYYVEICPFRTPSITDETDKGKNNPDPKTQDPQNPAVALGLPKQSAQVLPALRTSLKKKVHY
jgi:hypothetical protein